MCSAHFFTGRCSSEKAGGRRKSAGVGCRLVHNLVDDDQESFMTLHDVLRSNKSDGDEQLERSEQALSVHLESRNTSHLSSEPGSMDPVAYTEITWHDWTEGKASISARISECLSHRDIPLHSVVYLALDNILLFDRYRRGMLFPEDKDLLLLLLGSERAALYCRKHSIGSEADESAFSEEHTVAVQSLSAAILEHILGFLPDESVATFSQVCKPWNHEIGKKSPNLWKLLLNRHDWPHPAKKSSEEEEVTETDPVDEFRGQFLEHYSVMRDLKGIKFALQEVCSNSTGSNKTRSLPHEKEVAFQKFYSRTSAPTLPNKCLAVRIWSSNRVLIAYEKDCTLRLFESRSGTTEEAICRELVCQSFDPFRNTTRVKIKLLALALDQKYISWTCRVDGDGRENYRHIVVFATREEYLIGASSHKSEVGRSSAVQMELHMLDIRAKLLTFLLENGHIWPHFLDFVQDGGNLSYIWVDLPKNGLCSCGRGRFLLDVHIFGIPGQRSTFLVMCSAASRDILWVHRNDRWGEEAAFTSWRPRELNRASECHFAISERFSPEIRLGKIDAAGTLQSYGTLEDSTLAWNELEHNSWTRRPFLEDRPCVITGDHVVVADMVSKQVTRSTSAIKTILTFYHRQRVGGEEELLHETLDLEQLHAVRMSCIRDQYLVLVCRRYQLLTPDPGIEQDGREPGGTGEHFFCRSVDCVVVHIASKRVLGCMSFADGDFDLIPTFAAGCHDTVAVDLSCRGVALSGSDVRSLNELQKPTGQEPSALLHSPKKKKNRKVKNGCKDRYTRGLSMTG